MNIDRRHIYGICLDTETANTIQTEGGLDMSNVLFYDLGFQVIDSHGRTYGKKFSFVNSDIFYHEKELMKSAYYAKKIPQYLNDILEGKRIVANTIYTSLVLGAVITVCMVFVTKPLLHLLNIPDDIFKDAYDYIVIIFAGIGATMLYNVVAGMLRALGDSKTPLYFLVFCFV